MGFLHQALRAFDFLLQFSILVFVHFEQKLVLQLCVVDPLPGQMQEKFQIHAQSVEQVPCVRVMTQLGCSKQLQLVRTHRVSQKTHHNPREFLPSTHWNCPVSQGHTLEDQAQKLCLLKNCYLEAHAREGDSKIRHLIQTNQKTQEQQSLFLSSCLRALIAGYGIHTFLCNVLQKILPTH